MLLFFGYFLEPLCAFGGMDPRLSKHTPMWVFPRWCKQRPSLVALFAALRFALYKTEDLAGFRSNVANMIVPSLVVTDGDS